jgi:hypothetical protein
MAARPAVLATPIAYGVIPAWHVIVIIKVARGENVKAAMIKFGY